MIEGIAMLIMLIVSLLIAYHYGELAGKKKKEVKSLVEARSYPKNFMRMENTK